jgi:hypothetical protein
MGSATDRAATLRALVITLLGLGWLTSAAAVVAVAAGPASLLELPWAQIGVGVLISLWGGLARTASRVLGAQQARQDISLAREFTKDLLAASVIGFVTFAVSAWQSWDVWLLAVLLPLAGYGGARFLEPLSDAAVDKLGAALGRRNLTGKEGPP